MLHKGRWPLAYALSPPICSEPILLSRLYEASYWKHYRPVPHVHRAFVIFFKANMPKTVRYSRVRNRLQSEQSIIFILDPYFMRTNLCTRLNPFD